MGRIRTGLSVGGRRLILVVASLVAAVVAVSVAGARSTDVVTETVSAAADTYLRSGAPDTNEGGSSFLRVRASGDNRVLVRIDQTALQAAVANGTLVSAQLELTVTENADNWGSTGRTVSVFRLTSAWDEGNGFVDQGSPPNRGTGAGATWECGSDASIANQARDCSGATQWEMGKPNEPQLHPWVEPATATELITNGLTGTIGFDVTQDVLAFLSGSSENFGWIAKKDVEGAAGQAQFASRESGDSGPRLVLQVEAVSPEDQYGPEDPVDDTTTPLIDEAPGGGADDYDPDLDTDDACDAYVDFGIENWCLDPGGSAEFFRTPSRAAAAESAASAADYSECGLEAVFWSVGLPPQKLSEQLALQNVGAACGDYYFAHQPAQSNSEKLDPICLGPLRQSQPWPSNFHAAPVFQWSAWDEWVNDPANPGRSWYQAGIEFRNRMAAMGCQPGDRWFVNELPRAWRSHEVSSLTRQQVRARITNAVRGLYYGGDNPNVRGFTADVVMPHDQTILSQYQENLETAYSRTAFWHAMDFYLEGWGDETYAQCQHVCVPNKTARELADEAVNNYTFHQSFLAVAAPAELTQVKATMANRHFPLLDAFWRSDKPVYDTSLLTVRQMARLVRQQIYSTRRAAELEYGAAGRIGFAWTEAEPLGEYPTQLAANLARALHDAYVGDSPGSACVDNDGTGAYYYGCPPAPRAGATINTAWDVFQQWRLFE